MTFVESPIIPDATAENHPITRSQFDKARFRDFVIIKGNDYTVNTDSDMGQTGIITIYINATANNVTITLPGVLQSSPYYTYNFKRIDNTSFTAKIVSPLTIDGQTSIILGYLHSVTIKSVIDKYWIFSKYTP
jgi:putative cell wall-binding protein